MQPRARVSTRGPFSCAHSTHPRTSTLPQAQQCRLESAVLSRRSTRPGDAPNRNATTPRMSNANLPGSSSRRVPMTFGWVGRGQVRSENQPTSVHANATTRLGIHSPNPSGSLTATPTAGALRAASQKASRPGVFAGPAEVGCIDISQAEISGGDASRPDHRGRGRPGPPGPGCSARARACTRTPLRGHRRSRCHRSPRSQGSRCRPRG